jgi:hypothetical protein
MQPTSNYRPPRPGDYFVVKATGLVGAVIRLFTRSPYTHAGIVVDEAGTTVEALRSGAARSRMREGYVLAGSLPLSDEQRQAIASAALGLLGTPYGALDIVALGLVSSGIRWGWLLRRVQRSDRLICSAAVDQAYRAAGVALFDDGRPVQMVTPAALGELAAAHGWFSGSATGAVARADTAKTGG